MSDMCYEWQVAQDDVTQCITLKLDSLRETVTLGHVISQYCRWSLAPNLQCIICPSRTQIYKTHKIAGFAKSVIFDIGRFSYDQKRKETVKINTRITLPLIIDIELFDDNSRESYATESVSLTGVIVHTGRSAQSGHYIAALKNPSGVWYYYDDDITQSIEIDEFLQTHNRNIYFAAYTHNSSCS